jgi:hypothetical protein
MFKNLPRQTFGRLQSKLFPLYFGLSAACTAIQLGVLVFAAQAPPQKEVVLLGACMALGSCGTAAGKLGAHPP